MLFHYKGSSSGHTVCMKNVVIAFFLGLFLGTPTIRSPWRKNLGLSWQRFRKRMWRMCGIQQATTSNSTTPPRIYSSYIWDFISSPSRGKEGFSPTVQPLSKKTLTWWWFGSNKTQFGNKMINYMQLRGLVFSKTKGPCFKDIYNILKAA